MAAWLKTADFELSWLRPTVTILYLVIAARFFMAAVDRRKAAVFSVVVLAALVATSASFLSLAAYVHWIEINSGCMEQMATGIPSLDRMAESAAANAGANEDNEDENVDVSYRAEGRVFFTIYRAKRPLVNVPAFRDGVDRIQKDALASYCSENGRFLRGMKAIETQIFYGLDGERLTSFSIGPADCPKW